MTCRTLTLTAAALLGLALAVPARADPEAAMTKAGCTACHAKDKKLVGPSFLDIAKKNKGQADAVARLSAKVRHGGQGVYGPIPMPPSGPDKIPDADLQAAVEWILGH